MSCWVYLLVVALGLGRFSCSSSIASSFRAGYFLSEHGRQFYNNVIRTGENVNRLLQSATTAFAVNCTDGTPALPFEAYTLLRIKGRPDLVSKQVIAVLEEGFIVAYNQLLNCSVSGTNRIIDNVTILSTSTALGATNQLNLTTTSSLSSIIQEFGILFKAQGRSCNFCGTNATVFIFNNVSSPSFGFQNYTHRRRLHEIGDLPVEYNSESIRDDSLLKSQSTSFRSPIRGNIIQKIVLARTDEDVASKWHHDYYDLNVVAQHGAKTKALRAATDWGDKDASAQTSRSLQLTGVCDCQGPSEGTFTTLLNNIVLSASDLNTTTVNASSAIATVLGAAQLIRAGGCNPNNRSTFNATAIIRLSAASAKNLSKTDIKNIGYQFKLSYQTVNGLNTKICDPFFRRIKSVRYQSGLNQRRLANTVNTTGGGIFNVSYNVSGAVNDTGYASANGNATSSAGAIIDLVYLVAGTCTGCSSGTPLFDYATTRRRMQQQIVTPAASNYSQFDTTTNCLCPVGAAVRGPLEQEFNQVFNSSLYESSRLSSLQVQEVAPLACSSVIETFSSTVLVPLTLDPNISDPVVRNLEKCVASAYNLESGLYCDPYFRKIISVQSVEVPSYGVITDVHFNVIAECRGTNCAQNVSFNLFFNTSTSSRKLRQTSPWTVHSRRVLQSVSTCFCNVHSNGAQAQSMTDFVSGFNNCENSTGAGYISQYISVTSGASAQPSWKPSALSSRKPSSKPSHKPISKPSALPSREPSSKPSREPSYKPSVPPSRRPSSSPSRKPTSNPSRIPSGSPSSSKPTKKPSSKPSLSLEPSYKPSTRPSRKPSSSPSKKPSSKPSREPSDKPSSKPTKSPSSRPSIAPSRRPSAKPSTKPSAKPSRRPSAKPSQQPSKSSEPSSLPSKQPSSRPSKEPSSRPSKKPSSRPSKEPSSKPSKEPSSVPSSEPSTVPSQYPSATPSQTPTVTCSLSQPNMGFESGDFTEWESEYPTLTYVDCTQSAYEGSCVAVIKGYDIEREFFGTSCGVHNSLCFSFVAMFLYPGPQDTTAEYEFAIYSDVNSVEWDDTQPVVWHTGRVKFDGQVTIGSYSSWTSFSATVPANAFPIEFQAWKTSDNSTLMYLDAFAWADGACP